MSIYLCSLECTHRLSKYSAMASLSHRQGWSLAVFLTIFPYILFAGTPSGPNSDVPSATYRTGTSEVRVAFYATDADNHLVSPVGTNDFAVVDGDTVVRDFRSLVPSHEMALDIEILVDASESVASRLEAVKQQVGRLVAQGRADDRMAIVTFSGLKPSLLCAAECGNASSLEKLRALRPGGATPLFDSLRASARYFAERQDPSTRQVLILFSDGNDTISGTSSREALNAITATGAVLYTADVEARESRNSFALEEMAEATGGRSLSKQESSNDVLQAILADLRASYVVSYALPSRTAGFHSLRILPKHNLNLRFHCRRGYFYDEDR